MINAVPHLKPILRSSFSNHLVLECQIYLLLRVDHPAASLSLPGLSKIRPWASAWQIEQELLVMDVVAGGLHGLQTFPLIVFVLKPEESIAMTRLAHP